MYTTVEIQRVNFCNLLFRQVIGILMISDRTPFMANLVLSYHENNWEKFTKSAPFLTSEVSFLDLSIIIENKKIN